jgi:hypothetical protein
MRWNGGAVLALLVACLSTGCRDEAKIQEGTQLARMPSLPLRQLLFEAGEVQFTHGERPWQMELWSCGEDSECAGLGLTDGDNAFWLDITSKERLLAISFETVPHSADSVAVLVTADLTRDDSPKDIKRTWLIANFGKGPALAEAE